MTSKQWEHVRRAERNLVVAMIGIPVALGVGLILSKIVGSPLMLVVAWVPEMLFFPFAYLQFLRAPCPHCGNPFHHKFLMLWPRYFSTRCAHCGMEKQY